MHFVADPVDLASRGSGPPDGRETEGLRRWRHLLWFPQPHETARFLRQVVLLGPQALQRADRIQDAQSRGGFVRLDGYQEPQPGTKNQCSSSSPIHASPCCSRQAA